MTKEELADHLDSLLAYYDMSDMTPKQTIHMANRYLMTMPDSQAKAVIALLVKFLAQTGAIE